MEEIAHTVAIVVDRSFGDRLLPLSRRLHVWIIDSSTNRPARDKVWNETQEYTLESGATLFFDDGTQPSDVVVAQMLDDVERHHGEGAHTPPMSRLEVYGTPRTASLSSALADYGFEHFEDESDRFIASRAVEDPG